MKSAWIAGGLRFVELSRGRGEYLLFIQRTAMRLTPCVVV